jgi:Short C-terminal domain
MRRIGRPGLIGLAARTAVVAGTAGIVSGAASRRHQATDALDAQRQKLMAQEEQAQIAAAVASAVDSGSGSPGTTASAPDLISGLEKLAKLHADGVLTDAEFTAAKARLLR